MERECPTPQRILHSSLTRVSELVRQFSYPLRGNFGSSNCYTVLEWSCGHKRSSLDLYNDRCGRGPEHLCRLHLR